MESLFSLRPGTASAGVANWQELLIAIASAGFEVSLTYSPTRSWPNEAEEMPAERRWCAWATSVPGTDMCQYVYRASTPGGAMALLYAALCPQKETGSTHAERAGHGRPVRLLDDSE